MFVFAISAKAFSICDVSAGAAAVALFPFVWVSDMKSFGGDIVGVVDRGSTLNGIIRRSITPVFHGLKTRVIGLPYLSTVECSASA